jgi:hypothetical protein
MRIPGWHPDADVLEDPKTKKCNPKSLFLAEALFKSDSTQRYGPFPAPGQTTGARIPFSEPLPNATDADWRSFNKWMLGGGLPRQQDDVRREPVMTTLLRQLAVLARRYNASLYRLRRLHLFVYGKKDGDPDDYVPQLPPRNPFGDPELPPKSGETIKDVVGAAENDWDTVTTAIENFICNVTKHEYVKLGSDGKEQVFIASIVAADMVEVNGYLVSMRVIAKVEGEIQTEKIGGASSSHISISSAFSSS